MEKTIVSVNKATRPAKEEDESSSKTPTNENPVEEMINLNRMSEDASVLFSHLPEEIWLLIANKHLDSESLVNLSQASPVFRNLLLSRRVEFLFPQVWKVLGVKFEKREDEVYSYDIDEIFPDNDLSRFPDGKTPWCSRILTLRLVCKSWCEEVDNFYEKLTNNQQCKLEENRVDYFSKEIKWMGDWTDTARFIFFNRTDFINHFGPTHFDGVNKRNPVIGRLISIGVGPDGRDESGIFDVLSKYGQHFWFCYLEFIIGFDPGVKYYKKLKNIMQLLPNLKTLHVSCTYIEVDSALRHEISSHAPPKLQQLEFLSVRGVPACILNALVSVNNHISMLQVTGRNEDGDYDIYSLPNLTQLSMEYEFRTGFENLRNPEVSWALEKIHLRLNFLLLDLTRSQIFSLLENKWATTLTDVALSFPSTIMPGDLGYDEINDDSCLSLNLPKVQRLRVETNGTFSLDFMLPMQSLEFLEIVLFETQFSGAIERKIRLIEKNQVIELVGFFGRYHESNIWNLFPNLKTIQFFDPRSGTCVDTYTRECFENTGKTNAAIGPITPNQENIGNLWSRLRSVHD